VSELYSRFTSSHPSILLMTRLSRRWHSFVTLFAVRFAVRFILGCFILLVSAVTTIRRIACFASRIMIIALIWIPRYMLTGVHFLVRVLLRLFGKC
jgi:hypothetical protein